MRALKILVLAFAAAFAVACVPKPPLTSETAPQSSDGGFFVFGLTPDNAQIIVSRGSIENGKFSQTFLAKPAYASLPEAGYVVGRMRTGETMAIENVALHGNSMLDVKLFNSCEHSKTLSFSAQPGKVVYLIDVALEQEGRGLRPIYHSDIEHARAFMKEHYPQLAGKLEQGQYQFVPTDHRCGEDN